LLCKQKCFMEYVINLYLFSKYTNVGPENFYGNGQ
jgi:hypothetical protein